MDTLTTIMKALGFTICFIVGVAFLGSYIRHCVRHALAEDRAEAKARSRANLRKKKALGRDVPKILNPGNQPSSYL